MTECLERIRLADEYSRAVTGFSIRLDAAKRTSRSQEETDWSGVEKARIDSQQAWEAFERHVAAHQCLGWYEPNEDFRAPGDVLGQAAAAALDVVVVADDDRRFIDVNHAATEIMGLPRNEIVGRHIDDFFSEAHGETIPQAWDRFVRAGVQARRICTLNDPRRPRKFEYPRKTQLCTGTSPIDIA